VTSIVGVLCSDGVVIGSDSAATFDTGQFRTIEQKTEKIDIVGSSVIVAGTGSVGLHQRFASIVRQAYEGSLLQTFPAHMGGPAKIPITGKVFTKDKPLEIAKTLSRAALEDMGHTYLKPGQYAALMAFSCRREPYLCEFSIGDFQPELKEGKRLWFVSLGSAQSITDPFLGFIRRAFWGAGIPSVSDAIFAVTWTLQHAIDLNPGGVNGPVKIAVLEKLEGDYKGRILDPEELQEHQQNIEETYSELQKLRERRRSTNAETVPDVPKLSQE
jgi:hypothetical protein